MKERDWKRLIDVILYASCELYVRAVKQLIRGW